MHGINKNSKNPDFFHTQFPTQIWHSLPHYTPLDFLQVIRDTLGNNLLVHYIMGNSLGIKFIHLEQIAMFSFFHQAKIVKNLDFCIPPFQLRLAIVPISRFH